MGERNVIGIAMVYSLSLCVHLHVAETIATTVDDNVRSNLQKVFAKKHWPMITHKRNILFIAILYEIVFFFMYKNSMLPAHTDPHPDHSGH